MGRHRGRHGHGAGERGRAEKLADPATEYPMPGSTVRGRGALERAEWDLQRGRPSSTEEETEPPEDRAQALAYEAMDAPDRGEERAIAQRALKLDPGNVDAGRMVVPGGWADEEEVRLRPVVAEAERRLGGAAGLAERRGKSWDDVAARPYLRTRARLAEVLADMGRLDDAVAEYEALLDLDPPDHLALRFGLLALHLARGDCDAVRRLHARFEGEASAFLLWGRALERFLAVGPGSAAEALRAARTANRQAGLVLLSPWLIPWRLPEAYSPGDRNEALLLADCLWPAWTAHPEALSWLREAMGRAERKASRAQQAAASLRAEGVEGRAPPPWVECLLESLRDVPRVVSRAVMREPAEAVPWLLALLAREDMTVESAPGDGWAPAWAALLLGEIRATAAIPLLIDAMLDSALGDSLGDACAEALARMGPAAVEPALEAHGAAADEFARMRLAGVLAGAGVRDERIWEVLVAMFEREDRLAPVYLATYGDPRAIPAISTAFDATEVDPDDRRSGANLQIVEFVSAIERLGGTLSPAQRDKSDRVRARQESLLRGRREDHGHAPGETCDFCGHDLDDEHDEHDEGAEETPDDASGEPGPQDAVEEGPIPPAQRAPRPGRNDPCRCGSGRKYKKCHLAEDEAKDAPPAPPP